MAKSKHSYNKYILILAIVAIVISLISTVFNQLNINQKSDFEIQTSSGNFTTDGLKAFSLDGFVKAKIDVIENSLVISSGCKGVLMTPTEQQVYSILIGLGNVTDFRPQTHDLIKEIFDNYKIELLQAKIEREEDEIYYARLIVRQGDKILSLDSRPTDAIATALRYGKDIFISQEVLDKKGKDICAKQ
ncbi:MAG: bifunctional nuclease family protein [Candidatus Aenigmarchaeota archaeon]|nr:bifunctional nuclease family protein [Candidatus Aenigmarchaeota archaeon]